MINAWRAICWAFLLLVVSCLFFAGCGQVTATDVNGLVSRGPAVDASPAGSDAVGQEGEDAPDGAADNAGTATDGGIPPDETRPETVSTPEASPPSCPPPCSQCFDHLAALRVTECRPGCGTCAEKNGIPVDACWADNFQCVHTCSDCR